MLWTSWEWVTANRRRTVGVLVTGVALVMTARWVSNWGPSEATLAEGREIFSHTWVENDPLAHGGDGLGPVFNERSCVACHFQGGVGGAGTNEFNVTSFEVQPTRTRPERRAGVVHAAAVQPVRLESNETVRTRFPIEPGRFIDTGSGCGYTVPDFDPLQFESVNTPPLFGLGLVDDLSDWSIRSRSTSKMFGQIGQELQGDFSAAPVGVVRKVDGGIGKFGWKGQFSSLEDFVATACAVELGLSNPLRKQDVPHLSTEDADAKLDIDRRQLRALVAFVRSLPRPEQVLPTDTTERLRVEHGEAVFESVGCAECHTPSLGGIDGFYSDLLLHRVDDPNDGGYGPPRRDPEQPDDGGPEPSEWKTPPLWGVADSAPYFHDGGSRTLRDAILRHGGHAQQVRERFVGSKKEDQADVIAFLKTLRAPTTAIPVSLTSAD